MLNGEPAAALACGATASQIELASSIRAELHYEACRIIEYYRSGDRMPLEQLPGGRYVSRDVTDGVRRCRLNQVSPVVGHKAANQINN